MTSEVTYAEVRFKNGPSPAEPKASSGSETPLSRFQKCKPWFPWVVSGFLMLLSIILLVVIIGFTTEVPNSRLLFYIRICGPGKTSREVFLTNHTQNSQVENFCIGLTNQMGTNQWRWVDQTPLDPMLMFWRSKEPSNDDENCVVMHIGKGSKMKNNWNDVQCLVDEHHYVCETNTVFFSI
nr:collectin-12-like [Zootoca vivipara]